jgi:hypothetical protein
MRMSEVREVVNVVRRRRKPRATDQVLDAEGGGKLG